MNKTTKGALGASAAAVLLLGGAGSLAYWSDDAVVNGGTVNSGYLTIDPTAVAPNTTPCDAKWKHTNGPKATTDAVNVVPGDIITKTCTFVVKAKGDNLSATPTVPGTVAFTAASTKTGGAAPTTLSLPVTASYKLGTVDFAATDKVTEADDNKVLTTTIKVAFPYGSTSSNANDTQNLLVTLNNLEVKLVQDNKGV